MNPSLFVLSLLVMPTQVVDPIGGGTDQNVLTVPLDDNSSCRSCHLSAEPTTPMPANTYRGSMMDLAGVDPIFLASLEVAYDDAPAAAELCIKCHYPRGWLAGRGGGTPAENFGLEDDDFQGVQCDFCHRMQVPAPVNPNSVVPPPELSGVLISNAQIFVHDDATKRGPIDGAVSAGHDSVQSPLFGDSVLCAQCHDVSNTFLELIDDTGTSLGIPVPIERTYTEWRDSDFSDVNSASFASCYDCHMESYQGQAATVGGPPVRELHSHRLVGANSMGPQMVKHLHDDGDPFPEFAGIGPFADAASAAAREQVTKAATLEVVELVELPNERWGARVRVTNKAGHKLPTGYSEGRRMFLGHSVEWADGTAGVSTGNMNTSTWEFNVGQGPVRTWEILLAEGLAPDSSFHFAKVNRILKDNRIPPKGFTPRVDTPVVDAEYPVQADGSLANWDEVDLVLGVNDCWPAIVTATLSFQSSSGGYLSFLIANSPTFGPDLQSALDAVGAEASVMNQLTVAVHADGTIEPAAGPYACEDPPVVTPPEVDAGTQLDAGPALDAGAPVDAGPDEPEPPPPDDDDDEPVGCGCSQGASPDLALLGLCLLLGIGLRRRRRV